MVAASTVTELAPTALGSRPPRWAAGTRSRTSFADIPEPLRRSLYEAFQLQVRYHRPRYEVTIRATIRAESLPGIVAAITSIENDDHGSQKRSHLLCAPSGTSSRWERDGKSLSSGRLWFLTHRT